MKQRTVTTGVVKRRRTSRELTQPVKEEAPRVKLAAPSPKVRVTGPPGGPKWKKREAEGPSEATKSQSTEGEEDRGARLPKPRDRGMPRAPYRCYACGEWGHITGRVCSVSLCPSPPPPLTVKCLWGSENVTELPTSITWKLVPHPETGAKAEAREIPEMAIPPCCWMTWWDALVSCSNFL
uniref:CCHC-type domain-containing protein n=1 Tax=Chrysemys picta bellii TaxID=8478 RepID=A0A8C3H930_CHRPI